MSSILSFGRRALVATAIVVPLLSLAAHTKAEQAVKLRFGILGSSPIAALTAVDHGFFKQENLEIELVPLQSGPAAIAATTSGSVDLSYGDLLGWVGGLGNGFTNVLLIAPANGPAPSSLLVRDNSPIGGAAELKKKRVGTPQAPAFSISTKIWLEENGIGQNDVQFVVVPPSSEGQTLKAGSVDAVLAFSDLTALNAARQLPVKSIADPVTAAVPANATFAAYYANASFAKANAAAIDRAVRAIRRGGEAYNLSTPEERLKFNEKYANWDLQALGRDHPGFLKTFRFIQVQQGPIDVAATQGWADKAFKAGGLPRQVDIAPYIHPTALAAVSQ